MMWNVIFKSGAQLRMEIDDDESGTLADAMEKGEPFYSVCGPILRCSDVVGLAPTYDDDPSAN